jgi:hypothetical protein
MGRLRTDRFRAADWDSCRSQSHFRGDGFRANIRRTDAVAGSWNLPVDVSVADGQKFILKDGRVMAGGHLEAERRDLSIARSFVSPDKSAERAVAIRVSGQQAREH